MHTAPNWKVASGNALCLNAAPLDFSANIPKHILIDLHAGIAELRDTAANERIKLLSWAR